MSFTQGLSLAIVLVVLAVVLAGPVEFLWPSQGVRFRMWFAEGCARNWIHERRPNWLYQVAYERDGVVSIERVLIDPMYVIVRVDLFTRFRVRDIRYLPPLNYRPWALWAGLLVLSGLCMWHGMHLTGVV